MIWETKEQVMKGVIIHKILIATISDGASIGIGYRDEEGNLEVIKVRRAIIDDGIEELVGAYLCRVQEMGHTAPWIVTKELNKVMSLAGL